LRVATCALHREVIRWRLLRDHASGHAVERCQDARRRGNQPARFGDGSSAIGALGRVPFEFAP
jgi:hypothetical protein